MVFVLQLVLANNSSVLIAVTHLPLGCNAVRSFAGYFTDEIRGGAVALWPHRNKAQGSNRGFAVWRLHVRPRVCLSTPSPSHLDNG